MKITNEMLEEAAQVDLCFAKARVESGVGFAPWAVIWWEKDAKVHRDVILLAGQGMDNAQVKQQVFQMLKERMRERSAVAITLTFAVTGLEITVEQRKELWRVKSVEDAVAKGWGTPVTELVTVCQTKDWFVQLSEEYTEVENKGVFCGTVRREDSELCSEIGGQVFFFYEGGPHTDLRKRGVQ